MSERTVTLEIPKALWEWTERTAVATQRPRSDDWTELAHLQPRATKLETSFQMECRRHTYHR
jgi:hypothetical protein